LLLALSVQAVGADIILIPRRTPASASSTGAGGALRGRSLLLYECKVDFLDSMQDWSQEKRDNCCQQSKLFCERAQAPLKTAVNAGYDCDEGVDRWETEWLVGKKVWCCQKTGKGCSTQPTFDCEADFLDWRRSWAAGKMAYCCESKQRGCGGPSDTVVEPQEDLGATYDCEAASANWEVEWSDAKKVWCKQKQPPKNLSI